MKVEKKSKKSVKPKFQSATLKLVIASLVLNSSIKQEPMGEKNLKNANTTKASIFLMQLH